MRDPMSRIERFCRQHPDFGIKNLMKYVAIANVVFWLLGAVNQTLLSYLSFNAALILRGQVWRLLTFMLYPASSDLLALLVYYFYYWIGSTLEQYWGTAQFNIYFFSGVLLMIVYGMLMYFITGVSFPMDSYYLYLSMFFSIAVLFPDTQVLFMFFIPLKMKYLAIVDALFFLFAVVTTRFPQNLLPVVAVINFLIFCGGDLMRMLPRQPGSGTVNFRRESRRIRKEQESKLYTHKCSVCGRTDRDYPELEFRYCSACQGYHCFCSDHINNHIHFTE